MKTVSKKAWVSPKLEWLAVEKTLSGSFPNTVEGLPVSANGVTYGTTHGPES